MSTASTPVIGYLLHRPTVPTTAWYLYVAASAFSYTGRAEGGRPPGAGGSGGGPATSRAVPAGSGFSALTLCVATMRSPPVPVLSTSSPPKRFSQTIAGRTTAISAVADLR